MAPRASRSNWPLVDTIYCEAKCPDEDVYYSGSDDDQYESPRQRKRRYELAGQRFLAGSAPRLFSASLTGPFESSRGWKNPWASKTQSTRIARQPDPQILLATKAPDTIKIAKPHVKQISMNPRPDSAECHLPSPQSLKTPSLASKRHLYLEEEELQAVQAWRDGVCSAEPKLVQPSTTQATNTASPHKRKSSHNWLRVAPDKRSKLNSPYHNSSITSKTPTATLPDTSTQGGEQARLEPGTNLLARDSTNQLISPPKQASSTRNAAGATTLTKSKPRDELNKEQQAAASLSSPVSLRKVKQEEPSTELSPLNFNAKVHSISGVVSDHPNTTASHGTAGYETVRKPHRVSDDEEFVFDIALEPLSGSSDSAVDQADEELEHANDATLHKDGHGAPSLNDHLDLEKDGSPNSELSELSDSPELSDLEEEFDASEAESAKVPHESEHGANDDSAITETEMADTEATPGAINMTDGVNTELSGEADDGLTPEDESSVEDVPETGKTVKIDVSHTMLEEETTILASNESPDESDKDTRQLPQLDAAEDDASVTAVHEGAGGAPRVTAGPSTQSEAEDAVQPSPKVKQEVSESSLRAILRGFVPPNLWANPTRPSTGPAQTIQQPIPEMDELILPSVEDVPIETHVASQTARAEDYTTSTTDNVPVKEATESQQTVSFDQSSSARSEKLPTPQLQRVGTPPAHRTPTIPEHEVMADNEPSPNNHSPQVEAEVKTQTGALREHSSPFAQETATAPAIACEMAPPVTTPVTPLRTKTASPAGKPKTAEPRFAYKSFAAFATPSPERLRVQKRRKLPGSSLRHPNLKGILASLVTGSARRTSNRVSWCLPGEPGECVEGGADVLRTSRDVPSSPPPLKPLAELPTASNDKFAKHFSSVMKRTDGLRHRFRAAADTERLVESLCSSSLGVSGGPPPKSGAVHAREEHSGAVATGDGDAGAEHQDGSGARERTVSVEPMDMVEDMVREMGDFWQSWDVDAELDAARKTDITTARAGTQSQTSWR